MKKLENLSNLLKSYFEKDNYINIEYIDNNNMIKIEINERYYKRELNIIHSHQFNNNLMISILEIDNEENEEIELFKINSIIYELNEIRMNLSILEFIQSYLDIIE